MHRNLTPADHYRRDGYLVVPQVISRNKINRLLEALEAFKKSKGTYYNAAGKEVPPQTDEAGELSTTYMNLHWYTETADNEAPDALLDIFTDKCLLHVLSECDEQHLSYIPVQTLLFTRCPRVPAHQDHLHLDTRPEGHLVGVWIALEDIHPDSGPLFVYPQSHELGPMIDHTIDSKMYDPNHTEKWAETYPSLLQRKLKENGYRKESPQLYRGDILIWHSYVTHGSDAPRDPLRTRKSLACHYIPQGYAYFHALSGHEEKLEMHDYNGQPYHGYIKRKILNAPAISSLP